MPVCRMAMGNSGWGEELSHSRKSGWHSWTWNSSTNLSSSHIQERDRWQLARNTQWPTREKESLIIRISIFIFWTKCEWCFPVLRCVCVCDYPGVLMWLLSSFFSLLGCCLLAKVKIALSIIHSMMVPKCRSPQGFCDITTTSTLTYDRHTHQYWFRGSNRTLKVWKHPKATVKLSWTQTIRLECNASQFG